MAPYGGVGKAGFSRGISIPPLGVAQSLLKMLCPLMESFFLWLPILCQASSLSGTALASTWPSCGLSIWQCPIRARCAEEPLTARLANTGKDSSTTSKSSANNSSSTPAVTVTTIVCGTITRVCVAVSATAAAAGALPAALLLPLYMLLLLPLLISSPVSTVNCGLCASSASLLLSGGTPGFRYALEGSRLLLHQPMGALAGPLRELKVEAEGVDRIRKQVESLYSRFTGTSHVAASSMLKEERYITAEEAVRLSLIDDLIPTVGLRCFGVASPSQIGGGHFRRASTELHLLGVHQEGHWPVVDDFDA
ncbi:hypothetical protein ACSSS7_001610 [Eimeria intestinalis]